MIHWGTCNFNIILFRPVILFDSRYKPEVRNPSGNVVVKLLRVVWTAWRSKRSSISNAIPQDTFIDKPGKKSDNEPVASNANMPQSTSHWLQAAVPTFGSHFVDEVVFYFTVKILNLFLVAN